MRTLIQYSILFFIVIFLYHTGFAQSSNDYAIRKINLNALSLIDDYERECDIFVKDDYNDFLNVFKNEKIKIANDVLPDNKLNQELSVKEYPQILRQYFDKYSFETDISVMYLSPVRFDENGKSGELTIYTKKWIKGKHEKYGTLYSDTLRYDFVIQFDGVNGTYKIKNIKIHEKKGKYCIVEAYRKSLFNKTSLENEKLIIDNDTVKMDSTGKYFFKNVKNDLIISTVDETIYEKKMIEKKDIGKNNEKNRDKNVEELSFKEPFLFWQIELSTPLPNEVFINSKSNQYNINFQQGKNTNYSIGSQFGLILFRNQWSRYAISTGVYYDEYNYNLRLATYKNSYEATDPDNYEYIRTNKISSISETHNINFLSFPLELDARYHIYGKHFFNIGIGVRFYQGINKSYEIDAKGAYSGYYPDLFDITISENGVYDFGVYDLKANKTLEIHKNLKAWNFEIGWQYKLNRRSFIDCSFTYLYNSKNVFNFHNKKLSRNYENINSLTQITDKFYINNWLINVGFLINI